MNFYSLLSFIVFILYFGLGIYVLGNNPKSKINRNFFYFSLTISIWSYAYIYLFGATDKESVFFWDKAGSIGWCTFPVFILSFHLALTNCFVRIKKYIIALYGSAGIFFVYKSFSGNFLTTDWYHNGSDWIPLTENTSSPFYWLFTLYLVSSILLCITMIIIWRRKEPFKRVRIQSAILFITLSVTITGGYVTNFIIPWLKISEIPNIAHIISLLWVAGIGYSIIRYQLMTLSPDIAANEIIREMKELLFFVDNEGKITGVNKYTEEMSGYSNSHAGGKPVSEFFTEAEIINELTVQKDIKSNSGNIEISLINKSSKQIPVSITVSSIHDKAGEKIGSVIIGRDIRQKRQLEVEIDERKTAQDELKTAHDELEEKVRQRTLDLLITNSALQNEVFEHEKAKGDLIKAKQKAEESDKLKSAFLANMSHEIRTPLNGILGFTDILQDETINPAERQEYLNIIRNCGNHLLELINDIIDISKIEAGQIIINKTSFNLHGFLNNLYVSFDPNIKAFLNKDISFTLVTDPENDSLMICTDELRLRQVFVNLITNAIKFTEKGSIQFGYYHVENNKLKYFVKDTGVGIAEEKLSKIFERFIQVDNTATKKHRGTGLGLTITKELIELMGGSISVESKTGEGSFFSFTLGTE